MVKKYNCKVCKYDTMRLSDYKKHLLTNKHLQNKENYDILINSLNLHDNNSNLLNDRLNLQKTGKKQILSCKYCNKSITRSSNLKKHHAVCKEKII